LILDTNALSAAAEEDSGISGILAAAHSLALPVPVIGEYRYGIAQSRRSASHKKWFEEF
jgi:predicted nucleic acid-binding protein